MEAAIRGALEKAGIPGAQARGRIYDSARNALERSLERQNVSDPAQISQHREKLEILIADIEAEWREPQDPVLPEADFFAAAPSADQTYNSHTDPLSSQVEAPSLTRGAPSQEGEAWPDAPAPVHDPAWSEPVTSAAPVAPRIAPVAQEAGTNANPDGAANLDIAPDAKTSSQTPRPEVKAKPAKKAKTAKRKNTQRKLPVFASIFSGAVTLSFLGIGIWWLVQTGALQSAADRNTGVPNPPPSVEREDYAGGPQPLNPRDGFSSNWKDVYAPDQSPPPQIGANASAKVVKDIEGAALRITSRTDTPDGEVRIPLAADVMQELAGRQSVLALTVRTASPETTQMYVKCAFATLGDCGRHRFDVPNSPTNVIFNVDFRRTLAPKQGGSLIINSDITGAGRSIDLLAVRIRPLN